MGGKIKLVSWDTVVEAPLDAELIKEVFQNDKSGNQTEHAEDGVITEGGDSAPNEKKLVIDRIVDHSSENRR